MKSSVDVTFVVGEQEWNTSISAGGSQASVGGTRPLVLVHRPVLEGWGGRGGGASMSCSGNKGRRLHHVPPRHSSRSGRTSRPPSPPSGIWAIDEAGGLVPPWPGLLARPCQWPASSVDQKGRTVNEDDSNFEFLHGSLRMAPSHLPRASHREAMQLNMSLVTGGHQLDPQLPSTSLSTFNK